MNNTRAIPEILDFGVGAIFPFLAQGEGAHRNFHRDIYITIIKETSGIDPCLRRDDKNVHRAIYKPAKMMAILNSSSAQVLKTLGNPAACMTLTVENTREAANQAAALFMKLGNIETEIHDAGDIEINIPHDFMYFVVPCMEVNRIPLLFWPRKPDSALLDQMTPAVPWINL